MSALLILYYVESHCECSLIYYLPTLPHAESTVIWPPKICRKYNLNINSAWDLEGNEVHCLWHIYWARVGVLSGRWEKRGEIPFCWREVWRNTLRCSTITTCKPEYICTAIQLIINLFICLTKWFKKNNKYSRFNWFIISHFAHSTV